MKDLSSNIIGWLTMSVLFIIAFLIFGGAVSSDSELTSTTCAGAISLFLIILFIVMYVKVSDIAKYVFEIKTMIKKYMEHNNIPLK